MSSFSDDLWLPPPSTGLYLIDKQYNFRSSTLNRVKKETKCLPDTFHNSSSDEESFDDHFEDADETCNFHLSLKSDLKDNDTQKHFSSNPSCHDKPLCSAQDEINTEPTEDPLAKEEESAMRQFYQMMTLEVFPEDGFLENDNIFGSIFPIPSSTNNTKKNFSTMYENVNIKTEPLDDLGIHSGWSIDNLPEVENIFDLPSFLFNEPTTKLEQNNNNIDIEIHPKTDYSKNDFNQRPAENSKKDLFRSIQPTHSNFNYPENKNSERKSIKTKSISKPEDSINISTDNLKKENLEYDSKIKPNFKRKRRKNKIKSIPNIKRKTISTYDSQVSVDPCENKFFLDNDSNSDIISTIDENKTVNKNCVQNVEPKKYLNSRPVRNVHKNEIKCETDIYPENHYSTRRYYETRSRKNTENKSRRGRKPKVDTLSKNATRYNFYNDQYLYYDSFFKFEVDKSIPQNNKKTRSKTNKALNGRFIKSSRTKKFKCDECMFSSDRRSKIEHHKMKHIESPEYVCTFCNFTSTYNREFYRHMEQHYEGPPFECEFEFCGYISNRISTLMVHSVMHSDIRSYKCHICSYSCKRKYHLKGHMVTHSKAKEFMCSFCEKRYKHKCSLVRHLQIHIKKE